MPELPVGLRRHLEISRQPAGSAFHTSQVSISFGESIHATLLHDAWEAVSRAHVALRTTFTEDGLTILNPEPAFDWRTLDWEEASPKDLGAAWRDIVQADEDASIATATARPARITFIRLPNGQGHALWSFHAALLDDASISLVLHEWLSAYDSLRMGDDISLPAEEIPPESTTPDETWKAAFEGFVPPRPLIVLPLPDSTLVAGDRRSITRIFERSERTAFLTVAKTADADLRGLCGAAWAFVIARATASDDALLLEPVRESTAIGRMETFVPRRRAVEKCFAPRDLVRSFSTEAPVPPADIPALASALNLPPADVEPSAAFIYRDRRLNDRLLRAMPRWMAADTQLFQKTAPPLALRVVAADRPEISLDYDPGCLSDEAAELLFEAFQATLAAFSADLDRELARFAFPMPPAIVQGPDAPPAFRSLVPQCLHELFADIADEFPDAVAVESADEKLTFAQLNSAANQLARHLRKRGVAPGDRVGIAMPRSPRWVVALLGTLKTGASIVPLPETKAVAPAGLVAWIVEQLAEDDRRELPVIQMQADSGSIGNEKARGLQSESDLDAESIAWMDGGIMRTLTHEVFAAGLQSTTALLTITPADRVLHFAPPGSFSAVEEAFVALFNGATLVLRSDNRWPTRTAIQEFVQQSSITALSVPTPFWTQWTQYLGELSIPAPETLRTVVIDGELPSANAVETWSAAAPSARLIHRSPAPELGGMGLAAEEDASAPFASARLGQPGPAARARLVDRRGFALPAGLPGAVEIAAGDAEPFIPLGQEAFLSRAGEFSARGALELLVSPATTISAEAIWLAATAHSEVLDAFVESRLVAARQEWCVWILPRDSQRGEPHDFRAWLAGRLPGVPRRIRALPRFPLDDAGRIDVSALGEIVPDDTAALPARQGTEAEERLRQSISRALGGRRIDFDEIITDGRTKSQVATLLFEAASRELPSVEPADFTTGFSVRSLLRNARGRKSETHSKWMPIQPLRASGTQPPLVFIHDLDGTARPYAPIVAHLRGDQPCYAITARGLADAGACHATVAEMAQAYVEALRVFDANGPYRLIGYGFGGLVAFEMARRLNDAGAPVPLLVLLATEPPANKSPAGFLAGGWKRALPAFFGRRIEDENNGRRRRAPESPVLLANQEAARRYSASPTPLTAHVFVPENGFSSYRAVQGGWSACCADARFYQVPCSGPEMMDEPAVEDLANAIKKLARAEDLADELEAE